MKRTLLAAVLFSYALLFSNEIDFENSYISALKNSNYIKNLEESLRLDELNKNSETLPGSIGVFINASPGIEFNSNGDIEISKGSIGLTSNPHPDILLSASHTFDESTSASISYSLFNSSRSRKYFKNSFLIKQKYVAEAKKQFYRDCQKSYLNLFYSRKRLKLGKLDLELTKREILIRESRVDSGLDSRFELQEARKDLMYKEIELLNSEIELLRLETDFQFKMGVDITEKTIKPLNLPKLDIISLKTDKERIKKYTESSEYLTLVEAVRDQREGVKDAFMDLFPDLSIGTSIITENFEDFSGAITLGIDFSALLSQNGKVEAEKIILTRAERDLKESLENFYKQLEYSRREDILSLKKINLLRFNLEKAGKSLEISQFNYDQGDILKENLERDILFMEKTRIELENTRDLYIIETLDK